MFEKFEVLKNEEMTNHTSFKIGGPVKYLLYPKNINELKSILSICKKNNLEYFILGNGTNLLVSDKGFDGTIISLKNFNKIKSRMYYGIYYLTCGAGVNMSILNKYLLNKSISGLEWSYGIPGSVGGAVRMNAGAFENSIGNFIYEIKYLKESKVCICRDFKFDYRKGFDEGIILSIKLKLKKGNQIDIKEKMNNYITLRKLYQPYDYPSAGSVFKRKENLLPAKIMDDLGLKGMRVGDAMISTKHAGFIINLNQATAEDVLKLINLIEIIFNSKGYKFEREIIYLN